MPDICRFHPEVTVLAIGHRVPVEVLHEVHLAKHAPRVLDKPVLRFIDVNQVERSQYQIITSPRGFAYGYLTSAVVFYRSYGVARTRRTGPDDVWLPRYVLWAYFENVLREVDVFKWHEVDAEHLHA